MDRFSKAELKAEIEKNLMLLFSVEPEQASDDQFYKATSLMVRNILTEKQKNFSAYTHSNGNKEVYYLSMEFLMGRSLKNSLYNLEIVGLVSAALDEMGVKLENLYEYEPDPGLGNGGLGRLAACYLDGLASQDYTATGYCILYEYGIFKQKIIDGWQTELPDYWLPGGEIWLTPNPDQAIDVHFGGEVEEFWDYGYHHINYKNYNTVKAVPYDMPVSGYQSEGVSNLRLWKAVSAGIDMERLLARMSVGEAIADEEFLPKFQKSSGVVFFELPEGRIESIGDIDRLGQIPGCKAWEFDKHVGDEVNRITSSLNRYGYAIFQTEGREQTIESMEEARNIVRKLVKVDILNNLT